MAMQNLSSEATLVRARQDFATATELRNDYALASDRVLSSLAEPELNRMMETLQVTEEYLASPNPKHRLAALLLIDDFWNDQNKLLDYAERMAIDDPDSQVRGIALSILLGLFQRIQSQLVEEVVRDILRERLMNSDPDLFTFLCEVRSLYKECPVPR